MLNEDPGTTATESSSALDEVWVSIDLETTGLSPEGDEIIEVGAVKFAGERILDEFETFVNPGRRLSEFIRRYTGITQDDVDRAPPFSAVAPKLGAFIGSAPILGHNVAFDLNFLASKGLKLPNPRGDTWDLAYVLLPEAPEYALSKLAASLGVAHPRPHRAMEDAQVTREVFLRLTELALELNVYTLAQIQQLAARSSWTLSYFLGKLEAHKLRAGSALGARREPDGETSRHPGVLGFDTRVLRERLQREKSLRANQVLSRMDVDLVASLLADGGPLSRTMPGFEERAEQVEMARSVAEAINGEQRLIVEAGTGVGKSLAYLLPAAMYAIANNKRVVVSTNTINLQEQLLKKDVPLLLEALAAAGIPVEAFRFTQLKGRANYLCLRRWSHLASSESLSGDEARVLSKVLVWLESTSTGDRAELNLAHRSASSPWDRVSTQGALDCAGANGVCFLRAARERAAAAHLVIVNHALLMSDVTAGGTLIPSYDILIVDEAHHLEAEATRHLGFQLSQASADERLQAIGGDRGLLQDAIAAFRGSSASSGRQESVTKVATDMMAAVPSIRTSISELFAAIAGAVTGEDGRGLDAGQDVRITKATRSQPAWSSVEIAWENVDVSLGYLGSQLSALETSLDGLEESGLIDYEGLMLEIGTALDLNSELRRHLSELIPHPSEDGIYWASRMGRTGDMSLHSAPLHVGALLDKNLFTQKQSVILTSATLSTGGSFDHIRGRTGFVDAKELLVGSPFDYAKAALVCVPEDMPEPSSWAYQEALGQAISDAALAAGGRTMALFTSKASLQATAQTVRGNLQAHGIQVLAQGIDGTPGRLVRTFVDNPSSVILGTSSFWEGVDLAGDVLSVLLVARLPFSVPTDPVFEARSELFESSFKEYAVPQAILRLRQGFGRLIRTKTDRGVVVILDRRVVSRSYGKAFLNSLPPVEVSRCGMLDLGDRIRGWLNAD